MTLYDLLLNIAVKQNNEKPNIAFYGDLLKFSHLFSTTPLRLSGGKNYENDISISNFKLEDNNYYIYDYCGHSDDWIIEEHSTKEEVEKYISMQFNNMYTTNLFVFKGLKYLVYSVKNGVVYWQN